MTNNKLTDSQLERIIESADEVLSALAGKNDDVHPDNSTKMCCLWDDLNDTHAPPEVVMAMARELQEYRKAAGPVYQWREAFEEGASWDDCTKNQYEGFTKRQDIETRILYAAPQLSGNSEQVGYSGKEPTE